MQQGSLSQDSSILSGKCFASSSSISSDPFVIHTGHRAEASTEVRSTGAGKATSQHSKGMLPELGSSIQQVQDRMRELQLNEKKISAGSQKTLAQATDLTVPKADQQDVRSTSGVRGYDARELAALDIGQ